MEIELRWRNYFDTLLNISTKTFEEEAVMEYSVENSDEPDISKQELKKCIKEN